MNSWAIVLFFLKQILGSEIFKTLAADAIDALVHSTETDIDDQMAEPILKYLRSKNNSSQAFLKSILGNTVIKKITIDVINGLVKSTETDVDDLIAAPFLKYLK